MIADSSALVAVLLKEPGYEGVLNALTGEEPAGVGTPTLLEATIVMAGRVGPAAITMVSRLVQELQVVAIPFGPEHWREASDAYVRYGKGRHGAGLNFGDCMSYAVARLAAQPLLCLGGDFAQTDLELVPLA
jgi:ribonuclease VapC